MFNPPVFFAESFTDLLAGALSSYEPDGRRPNKPVMVVLVLHSTPSSRMVLEGWRRASSKPMATLTH